VLPGLLALLSIAGAAVGGLWVASGFRRARRDARRVRGELQGEIAATDEVLESRERALKETARQYVDAQVAKRLKEVPLEKLREQTDRRVKVAPLAAAGYATVGDLVGRSQRELRAVRGIGPFSARTLEKAVREYVDTARLTAPAPPRAELGEPRAVDLARDALTYLEAWRRIGERPPAMRAALDDLAPRLAAAVKEASFFAWLLRGRERAAREAALRALVGEAQDVAGREPFAGAGEARLALQRTGTGTLSADGVREAYGRAYADCCSLLERVFAELGYEATTRARTPAEGPAPAELAIARRVEAHPLDITGLKVILRRYQAFGARYLLCQERTVLGDEMGLGKTIQALAAMQHLANGQPGLHALVVAPASILGNWMHEIAQRTPLPGRLLHGDDFEEALAAWRAGGGVAVTSYSTLRLRLPEILAEARRIALLVADEAHYVKNPEARRTQALVRVTDRAERVCFLSGTPLENHPEEFVHLLESLAPARARDLADFLRRPGSVLGGPRRFHAELADVYLRRNQEDVLTELPEKLEKEEWIDLTPEERAAYGVEVRAGNFMGMRRAVTAGTNGQGAKLERLEDLLEEYRQSGVKVLLFSYFLDVLAAVRARFPVDGLITGDVPPERRFETAQAFQAADGHRLLAAQIEAGGTGLNLHAAGAVVLMEPQLKPTTEAQAIARAHRMGQTRRVVVHRMLARDSVDERIVELLKEKEDLFERFARESLVKEASAEATAPGPLQRILAAERARLPA